MKVWYMKNVIEIWAWTKLIGSMKNMLNLYDACFPKNKLLSSDLTVIENTFSTIKSML